MGGFMPTPPAPAQPPQVKLDTTAASRGNFNTFLKNLNGATSLNPPSMAPTVGAAAPSLAPTMSDIDIFNQPVAMMQFGGDPMDASFSDFAGFDDPSDPFGGGDTSSDDVSSNDFDDSAPDEDIDYTDIYDTEEERKEDFDTATEIGQQVAADQAAEQAQAAQRDRALDAVKQSIARQAVDKTVQDLQQQSITQPSLSSAMTGRGGTTGAAPSGTASANIAAAAGTDFSNIGVKGDDDPLGLSLQGVGLGPSISTPKVASKGPPSGPSVPTDDVTGFGGKGKDGRDVSDFSTDLDALANVKEQATKGSFPGLDNIPGTFGGLLGLVNAATKTGAQNTLRDISRGFTPTYDKDGNITGTTNFGIGMGQPGGLFGQGTTVLGYQPFDETSPSIKMYRDQTNMGGDESEPIIKPLTPKKEDEKEEKEPSIMGGVSPILTPTAPVIVESPFTTNVGDFQGVGFDAGDLNALIAEITRQRLPTAMAKGGIAKFANGGLIKAVDDFLATGT